MNKEFEYLVFIGRFQPFHIGHFSVLKLALQKSHKVIVIVGSANRPRTVKNPLTFEERKEIIHSLLSETESERVSVIPISDYTYNDTKWMAEVQHKVSAIVNFPWHDKTPKIGIIGHTKDDSSYYIKMFPQWEAYEVSAHYVINATDIRNAIYHDTKEFNALVGLEPAWFVNKHHMNIIVDLFNQPDMKLIHKEYEHLCNYKKQWSHSPFPPVFVTVDAVVVQSGHILLVKRGAMPGEGQWALPGGFINQNETIEAATLRELIEETKIGVRFPKLKGSIVNTHVFDAPYRSQRGRTITHASYILLPNDEELPTIKGSDDAAHAQWVPLSELEKMQNEFFEDHFDIIDYFTNT